MRYQSEIGKAMQMSLQVTILRKGIQVKRISDGSVSKQVQNGQNDSKLIQRRKVAPAWGKQWVLIREEHRGLPGSD